MKILTGNIFSTSLSKAAAASINLKTILQSLRVSDSDWTVTGVTARLTRDAEPVRTQAQSLLG